MNFEPSFLKETIIPPAAASLVAAITFYLAWFRTKKRSLFSDTHGSRWDVAGLAIALTSALYFAHGWRIFATRTDSLHWIGYACAAVLFYLMIAALFSFPESADSTVISILGVAAIVLSLKSFSYFFSADETTSHKWIIIVALSAGAFLIATSYAFLAWRLEAIDVFLTALAHTIPVAAYIALRSTSISGASTYAAFIGVSLIGLAFTFIGSRKIRLTLTYGLFFGLFATAVLLYFGAAATNPPTPLGLTFLALGSLLPAIAAIHPSIAENRKLSKTVLPSIALFVTSLALFTGGGGGDTGGY